MSQVRFALHVKQRAAPLPISPLPLESLPESCGEAGHLIRVQAHNERRSLQPLCMRPIPQRLIKGSLDVVRERLRCRCICILSFCCRLASSLVPGALAALWLAEGA